MLLSEDSFIRDSSIGENVQLYGKSNVLSSSIGDSCIIGEQSRIRSSILHEYVKIDRNILVYHSNIGKASYVGAFSMIFKADIGKYCSISYGITIGPPEHDYKKVTTHPFIYDKFYETIAEDSLLENTKLSEEVIIGNDVWIGANVTILRGVTIGHGAVIGANALVNKDVPPYAIVAGNPAKVIKYRFSADTIEKLLDISWWNWSPEKMKVNSAFFTSADLEMSINEIKEL